jgi:hypothetical protein
MDTLSETDHDHVCSIISLISVLLTTALHLQDSWMTRKDEHKWLADNNWKEESLVYFNKLFHHLSGMTEEGNKNIF